MAITTQMRTDVAGLYAALFNRAPESEGLGYWVGQLGAGVSVADVAQAMYNTAPARVTYPSFLTNEEIISKFYVNVLGRTADAEGAAYWTGKLNAGASQGQVITEMITAVKDYSGTDPLALTSQSLFNNKVSVGLEYAVTLGGNDVAVATNVLALVTTNDTAAALAAAHGAVVGGGSAFTLTTGADTLLGSTGDDVFDARIMDNSNTLQSGDKISGGVGDDRLNADIGNSQDFAITAETTGIETVSIRAQAVAGDSNNNNMNNEVQIDAQRMVGVTQWESSNSRADVIIEDVRITNAQITKDITIAMVETDPGHVDMGVYFDQYSLRAQTNTSATLTLQLMDTRSQAAGTGPLKDSPYDGFAFNLTAPGATTPTLVEVRSDAIDDALTYADLVVAINAALQANPATVAFTASLGSSYTANDTLSGSSVTGTSIVLTANDGSAVSAEGAGTGWLASGAVPPSSGLHTEMSTAQNNTTDLVTSKIILDDVGRGSTGGDLVVGGLSVGDTSDSLGVQRFEIEVRDNSKLQTINSTNNTLREVTIVNGATTSSSFAYVTTTANAGNLTVNGTVGAVGGENAALPGSTDQHNAFGFSDVRLIDGSAMTGKLAFTAEVTTASIAKYLDLEDQQASPSSDNIAFAYTGGANNDTLSVTLDSAVVGSTNTLTGREDFTFTVDGGAGNDSLTLNIGGDETGAWVDDQFDLDNVTVNGGAGDDTIRTPGAGRVIINAGAGNDTVYADNSGTIGATWLISADNTVLTDLEEAATATSFLYDGQLTVSFSGAGGAGLGGGVTAGVADAVATAFANGFEVVVDIPTGDNYGVNQFHINQAIKNAINGNEVLNKLLVATDGPGTTLSITSLIDGAFSVDDLMVTVSGVDVTTLTASEQSGVLTAYKAFAADSTADINDAEVAQAASVVAKNIVPGMDVGQVLSGGSGLAFSSVITQGVTAVAEVQTTDLVAVTVNDTETLTFNLGGDNVVYTNATGGALIGAALAADIALTLGTSAVGAAGNYVFAAGAADTLTITQDAGNESNIALFTTANQTPANGTGVAVETTAGVAEVTEVVVTTITGTASAGETVTFDGVTTAAFAGGETGAQVAAALDALADGVTYTDAAVGNVLTNTATAPGAVVDGVFTSSMVASNGTISGAESDNTINLATGDDVLVLGTGAASNDTVEFTGYALGHNTIVNFTDTVGANQDVVDFTSYLNGHASPSGSTDSAVRIATSLNADATVEANSVTVLTTAAFDATDTFAGLDAATLLAAVNSTNTGTGDYAGITAATLNALNTYTGSGVATTLVGGIGKSIVLVQNDANEGEYAVFELTFNGLATNTAADFTSAQLVGVVDFGNSVDFSLAGVLA